MLRYKTKTRPGLVALYDIRPGNGAGPFLQPRSPHGATPPCDYAMGQLKIVTGHVAINPDQTGLVAADNRTRANHRYKFRAIGASSTGLRYSFAVRTISDWNKLPAVVVE